MTLTPHQQEALERLTAFIRSDDRRIFVLKGYAGTGKTTLVGRIVEWLDDTNLRPVLLATTGRAAKVLQNKTGGAVSTIHSCIYTFQKIDGRGEAGADPWDSDTGQLFLDFGLRAQIGEADNLVFIVDEASMISHEISEETYTAKFGTGSLLDDFLQFAGLNKIIFVGDPCQLPPVAKNPFSGALNEGFLANRYGLKTEAFELREIIRQDAGSEILKIAGKFRDNVISGNFEKYPKIILPRGADAHLYRDEEALLNVFLKLVRTDGFDNAVMICHANWQCSRLNNAVRQSLGMGAALQEGELLMVVQNSYDVDLANGDQVVVEKAAPDCVRAGMEFLNVTVRALHNEQKYETKLIADLLYNEAPGLSPEHVKALLIDFDKRMRMHEVKRNSEVYKQAMLQDPYLNALRAKFGYAVTCHKAQGGEWDHVFLNIFKSLYGMQGPNLYRWYYTALTRARRHLHVNDGWWVEGFNWRRG